MHKVDDARSQLFNGRLTYTDAEDLKLVAGGEPREFRAVISGGWYHAKKGEVQAPVKAGARIGVRLRCSGAGVRCTPLSSERQNVLTADDVATWKWDVSAKRAGKVRVVITASAYFGDSDVVLVEKPPMTMRAKVTNDDSTSSWAKRLWRWVTQSITTAGGLATSVTAIAAAVFMVMRRRQPGDASEAGGSSPDTPALPRQAPRGRLPRLGRPRTRSFTSRNRPRS